MRTRPTTASGPSRVSSSVGVIAERGVSRALARAAVSFARDRGARAIEGYPITTTNVIMEELLVGTVSVFADAGLSVVSRPTLRRVVMRLDF